ncbi:MAG TPA: ABC transporter substrate-binding protein [Acidimicrobiales bacterium]|jgi:sulfonate transport system substrate-binding protein|nr:ABC transporter substrate-binding protein [Acidimicrobiales bacterium]
MTRPRLVAGACACVAALVVAACGTGSRSSATDRSVTRGSVPAAVDAVTGHAIRSGLELNIGDQDQFLETLFKASGALTGASYKANFVEFDSGPLVDAGFAAKRIDIGFMGDLPASLAAKSGLPVEAVAAFLPIGASEYLLAKPGISAIAQLKGRPVAYTTGTSEQAFALRALATAGLTQKDVHQVNVSLQQLGTVLQSGAADASVVSVEQKVDYQQSHPGATVLATIASVQPASYAYLLGTRSAIADPDKLAVIDDFTHRLIEASNWEKAHPAQFIQDYYVTVEHQTTANARLILSAGGSYTFEPLGAAEQTALQNVVDLMSSAGAIPTAYRISPLFDPAEAARYNQIVKGVPQSD